MPLRTESFKTHGHSPLPHLTVWRVNSFIFIQMKSSNTHTHSLISSMADGPTRVGHVVDQDGHAVFDVSNEDHTVHLVSLLSLLVDEGKVHVQTVCYGRDSA